MSDTQGSDPSTNRGALISLLAALLTLLALCGAVVPIPLTGFVCYPAAALLGIVAFITGLISLRRIRATGEGGRSLALIGVGIGSLAVAGATCIAVVGIWLYPYIAGAIHGSLR
jgi:hypothetical protein